MVVDETPAVMTTAISSFPGGWVTSSNVLNRVKVKAAEHSWLSTFARCLVGASIPALATGVQPVSTFDDCGDEARRA